MLFRNLFLTPYSPILTNGIPNILLKHYNREEYISITSSHILTYFPKFHIWSSLEPMVAMFREHFTDSCQIWARSFHFPLTNMFLIIMKLLPSYKIWRIYTSSNKEAYIRWYGILTSQISIKKKNSEFNILYKLKRKHWNSIPKLKET